MTAQFHAPISVRYKDWTPRQKQVLDLLVRGQTNGQIAASLGISLDGAKWHVSEIISRLGVDSREEAADYWRTQNGIPARLFRAVRALIPGAAASKVIAGGVGVGLFAGLVVAVIVAWPGPDADAPAESPGPDPIPSVTAGNPPVTAANIALTNGTNNYTYEPTLSYLAPGGVTMLVDGGAAAAPEGTISGCNGLTSAKQAILTGGLLWSANGGQLICLNEDASVLAADASGANAAGFTLFAANECTNTSSLQISPTGESAVCAAGTVVILRTPAGDSVRIPADIGGVAYSPAGNALVVGGGVVPGTQPGVSRLSWDVYSTDGTKLGSINDAYIAAADAFTWNLGGTKIAYPGDGGLTVVDLAQGFAKVSYPFAENDGRVTLNIAWVLQDSAVIALGPGGADLVSIGDGSRIALPEMNYFASRVAPDGRHVAISTLTGTNGVIQVLDLETKKVSTIPGSEFTVAHLEGMGTQFAFSGDSSRVCWMAAPSNTPSVACADLAGGNAFGVEAPIQVEPDVLGSGDVDVLWWAFSPDLTRIAYTTPGLADPAAQQTLWVSDLDGSNAYQIGPAQGPIPYEWQPDAVYRPFAALQ